MGRLHIFLGPFGTRKATPDHELYGRLSRHHPYIQASPHQVGFDSVVSSTHSAVEGQDVREKGVHEASSWRFALAIA